MTEGNNLTIGGSVIQRSVVPAGLSVTINVATVPMIDVCGTSEPDPEDLRDLTAQIVGIPTDVILDDREYAGLVRAFQQDELMMWRRNRHPFWRGPWYEDYRELVSAARRRSEQEGSPIKQFADDSLSLMAAGPSLNFGAWPPALDPFPRPDDAPDSLGIGNTREARSSGLACVVAGATADRRVRDFIQSLWTYDIPTAHSPKTTSDSLLRLIESSKKMCLAPVAAGGLLGVAQLGQGTVAPIVTVATGGAMTLVLISTLAVGDLIVRHLMKRRPKRRG